MGYSEKRSLVQGITISMNNCLNYYRKDEKAQVVTCGPGFPTSQSQLFEGIITAMDVGVDITFALWASGKFDELLHDSSDIKCIYRDPQDKKNHCRDRHGNHKINLLNY